MTSTRPIRVESLLKVGEYNYTVVPEYTNTNNDGHKDTVVSMAASTLTMLLYEQVGLLGGLSTEYYGNSDKLITLTIEADENHTITVKTNVEVPPQTTCPNCHEKHYASEDVTYSQEKELRKLGVQSPARWCQTCADKYINAPQCYNCNVKIAPGHEHDARTRDTDVPIVLCDTCFNND